jgi:hypothetical protein
MMFSPRVASSLSSNGISCIDPDPGGRVTKPTLAANETILPIRRNNPETHWAYLYPQQTAQSRREAQMNHSIHSADRSTHLKIVVVALVAGVAVAAFGIAARSNVDFTQTAQSNQVVKAGKPVAITSSGTSTVR